MLVNAGPETDQRDSCEANQRTGDPAQRQPDTWFMAAWRHHHPAIAETRTAAALSGSQVCRRPCGDGAVVTGNQTTRDSAVQATIGGPRFEASRWRRILTGAMGSKIDSNRYVKRVALGRLATSTSSRSRRHCVNSAGRSATKRLRYSHDFGRVTGSCTDANSASRMCPCITPSIQACIPFCSTASAKSAWEATISLWV
jgi:hypothetical protein